MPSESEIVNRRDIEDGISRIVGTRGTLAMTRTGNGGCVWLYYVDNVDSIVDPIKDFFDAQPPLSVRVSRQHDEDWKSVSKLLAATAPPLKP